MSQVQAVGRGNFQSEVVESTLPVVVDFTAVWCPPCKALAPIYERLAARFDGQVKMLKCDVDQEPQLAQMFGVQGIPNLLFFRDGQVVNQFAGYLNEAQLAAKVAELLAA
jgi:thioredoxin 1